MTKAPQIKAHALTAGLFHAHKPPLVPAHSALPIIRAIPSCLSSGKLFPAFHTGNSSLPLIQAILPCLSSGQLFPASHTGHSAISLNGAILSLQSIPVQQQPIVIKAALPYPCPAQSYLCNSPLADSSSTTTATQHLHTASAASDCAIPLSHKRPILSL